MLKSILTRSSKVKKLIQAIPYRLCLAKLTKDDLPGMKVLDHCLLSARVAKEVVKHFPKCVTRFLPRDAWILVAYHDIGKVCPGFAFKISPNYYLSFVSKKPFDGEFERLHALVSEKELVKDDPNWAKLPGAHHGIRTEDALSSMLSYRNGGESWHKERVALRKEIEKSIGRFDFSQKFSFKSGTFTLALITLADWIASDEHNFDQSETGYASITDPMIKEVVDKIFCEHPEIIPSLTFEDLFGIKEPNKLQKACIKIAKKRGIFVVEAPMGEGKTEAALALAYYLIWLGENDGIYCALPTKNTSNMIHKRILNFLSRAFKGSGVGSNLVHGDSWITNFTNNVSQKGNENGFENDFGKWFRPSKRALLSIFGVGTIDNALMSILTVKHNYLRTLGLAGKVVIIDEIHCYDFYTSSLVNKFISHLKEINCTVIVLSATLDVKKRNSIFPSNVIKKSNRKYPLISYWYVGDKKVRYVSFKSSRSMVVKIVRNKPLDYYNIIERARRGEKIVLLRNTVGKAQESFENIKSMLGQGDISSGLLHSRYTLEVRSEIEEKYINIFGKGTTYQGGFILVATQIIEQSLDIDCDYLLTDFCPIDILFQRIGRLWRHNRVRVSGSFPEVFIIEPGVKEGHLAFDSIYDKYICERTYDVLDKVDMVNIPSDIRDFIERVYRNRKENNYLLELKNNLIEKREKMEGRALTHTKSFVPTTSDDEKGFSRYSAYPTIDVLLLKDIEITNDNINVTTIDGLVTTISKIDKAKFDIVGKIKIHKNIVNIPMSEKRMKEVISLDDQIGEKNKELMPMGVDTIMFYDDDGKLYWDKFHENYSSLRWSKELGVKKDVLIENNIEATWD